MPDDPQASFLFKDNLIKSSLRKSIYCVIYLMLNIGDKMNKQRNKSADNKIDDVSLYLFLVNTKNIKCPNVTRINI